MAFKGNTLAAGTLLSALGSNDLYDLSKFPKNVAVVTNSITAGQTFDLKQLLVVNTLEGVEGDTTKLLNPKAGFGNVQACSKSYFSLQAAQVNNSGELVYTFKAGTGKTSSSAQLPGIALNYSDGSGKTGPGMGSKISIYLFQIK